MKSHCFGLAVGHDGFETFGCSGFFSLVEQIWTDNSVRADERAAVALNALVGVPDGHLHGNAALLVGGQAHFQGAVDVIGESAHRQVVALLRIDRLEQVAHHGRTVVHRIGFHLFSRCPRSRNLNLANAGGTFVDGGHVLVHNFLAFSKIGLAGGGFHSLERHVSLDNARAGEEGGLKHRVGVASQTDIHCNVGGVNHAEAYLVECQRPFRVSRKPRFKFGVGFGAVQKERAARLHFRHNIVFANVTLIVAGHKIGALHVVRTLDGVFAEAQVRFGHAERLFGVILKVSLTVESGALAHNVDGVLVGAHCSVAAQAPELATEGVAARIVERQRWQRQVRNVVGDADGEAVFRFIFR